MQKTLRAKRTFFGKYSHHWQGSHQEHLSCFPVMPFSSGRICLCELRIQMMCLSEALLPASLRQWQVMTADGNSCSVFCSIWDQFWPLKLTQGAKASPNVGMHSCIQNFCVPSVCSQRNNFWIRSFLQGGEAWEWLMTALVQFLRSCGIDLTCSYGALQSQCSVSPTIMLPYVCKDTDDVDPVPRQFS